jgi:Ca2+/Na+ antiporter
VVSGQLRGRVVARTNSSAIIAATTASSIASDLVSVAGSGAGSKWQCTAHIAHSSTIVRATSGAHLLVANAATAEQRLGVPQTRRRFHSGRPGTSLPELVTAVEAQRRRNADLLVGNLLGSNLFNSLTGGAIVGLADRSPAGIGYPVLAAVVAVIVLTWLVLHRRCRVSRIEAALLLVAYPLTLPLIS